MNRSNKIIGNVFESYFCEYLAQRGFWVHNLAQNKAGQPADVIAMKDRSGWLIDCKVCTQDGFRLSRVEENQWYAMDRWIQCVKTEPAFAILLNDHSIYMIYHYQMLQARKEQRYRLSNDTIKAIGTPIDDWIERVTA